jgi:MOSC domain-containing protein YiiM
MPRDAALEAIWIKRVHRGPMDATDRASLKAGSGIVGNADLGGKRQVTFIEQERWAALREELGPAVVPSARRANLMVRGVRLADSRDRILEVGAVRIRIQGETTPCARMDEACPGLRDALAVDWGGGAYGQVLNDGEIAVGDSVRWIAQ